jgi:tetratricopeptide (TPR) repeat protein
LLTAVLAGLITNEVQAQDLRSAQLLTKSEQYDEAGEMLQQLIQKEPANSKYYFFLGENYLLDYFADTISNSLTEYTTNAKEVFQKGVNANQNDPLNYVGLAKVANYLGDENAANEMRTKAKSLLPVYKKITKKMIPPAIEYAFALAKIAESYITDGEVDTAKALPLIRQALTLDKANPEIYLIAGDIYILSTDGSNAIKNYNLAQFADPKSPTANMKIGNIYVRGKSLKAAIPYFEEAIALDADYAPAYRELGQLYSLAGNNEQSKTNYKKYIDLTKGNIPAQTRYVTSLFYAGDYDEVIKNVEEIFAVDKSRSYMNRLAGYSYYEKKNADYTKALFYMDELFRTLAPERILWKDHHYLARIIMKKNQNYPKLADELENMELQLVKENQRYASASTANKPKIKPAVDDLTARVAAKKAELVKANVELSRGFEAYGKVLELKPQDRGVLSEIYSNSYNFKRYSQAAKARAAMIDPAKDDPDEWMIGVGRIFYIGEKLKSADSVFNLIVKTSPAFVPAHLWIARTYSKMDPDYKSGLAKPKFEKLLQVAKSDSIKNEAEMIEALEYLGYYHMDKSEYNTSKIYYNRMIGLNPNSKESRVKGYNGLGLIELRLAGLEKTIEGRLALLARSRDAYTKILAIDPNNASAKAQLDYIGVFETQVRAGINPNEIKGVIKDTATGAPIPYASVRIKDTAAEVMSNTRGEFKFEIPQGSETLLVGAKGYQSKEVAITKTRVYNVSLEK